MDSFDKDLLNQIIDEVMSRDNLHKSDQLSKILPVFRERYIFKDTGGDTMDKELKCLRCGKPMILAMSDRIQLGDKAIPFSHFASGSLKVDIYYCKECGKLEFYNDKLLK